MKGELYSVLEQLEEKVEKELKELTNQQNLSGQDLDKMLKATCVLESMDMLMGKDDFEYSGRSYGMHSRVMPHGEISYDRGRSPRTGRYVSRGVDNYGYSSHSISDRMVDSLERMYDQAQTDHERKILDTWISRIRSGEM